MDKSMYGRLSAGSPRSRHTSIYIHIILTFLKKRAGPVQLREIERETGISIEKTPGLLALLERNKKVRREGSTLVFVSTHSINSEEDLLALLRGTNSAHGIPLDEILDSSNNTKPFVLSAVRRGDAFALKDIDGSIILFYNSLSVKKASEQVQRLYEEVSVPDERRIARELASAGLAPSQERPARRVSVAQRKKKYARKIKITNTHVDHLNLPMDK
jgi:TFIIE beta subunit core domain